MKAFSSGCPRAHGFRSFRRIFSQTRRRTSIIVNADQIGYSEIFLSVFRDHKPLIVLRFYQKVRRLCKQLLPLIILLRARTRTRVARPRAPSRTFPRTFPSAHSRAHYLRRSRYAHPARKNACVRRKNRRKRRRDAGRRTLVSHTRANAVFKRTNHAIFGRIS